MMKCTEQMAEDHAALRRGLDILDGMVNKLEHGLRIEISDVAAILTFFRVFGDEYHQLTEETVFFPLLLRAVPDNSLIQRMVSEHEWQRTLIGEIENTMKSKKVADFVRMSRRFTMLFRNHLN